MLIPTLIGYATFFLLFYLYQKLFFGYKWLAIIPFAVVTAFFIKENMREWKEIKQQG
jgi:hypothetical protein